MTCPSRAKMESSYFILKWKRLYSIIKWGHIVPKSSIFPVAPCYKVQKIKTVGNTFGVSILAWCRIKHYSSYDQFLEKTFWSVHFWLENWRWIIMKLFKLLGDSGNKLHAISTYVKLLKCMDGSILVYTENCQNEITQFLNLNMEVSFFNEKAGLHFCVEKWSQIIWSWRIQAFSGGLELRAHCLH